MVRWLLAVGALFAATPAYALDAWMWGVGPKVGTLVLPGAYPARFPTTIKDEAALERVRTDVIFGVDTVYYANSYTRLGASGAFDVGSGFFDLSGMLEYNWVKQMEALDFIVGGGVGAGQMRFTGDGSATLRLPYYPLRVETGALIRDNSRGYQLTAFAAYNLPANHFYTNAAGDEIDRKELEGVGFYGTVGIELAVMFGDFTPPKPKRSGGGDGAEGGG